MKCMSLLSLTCGLMLLAACESAPVSSGPTTYEPAGAQARTTVEIPASPSGTPTTAQPYALEGSTSGPVLAAPMMGYQAR